jgi:hypothetical protein
LPTRQTAYNRRADLSALRRLVPSGSPVIVRDVRGVFEVDLLAPSRVLARGRRQVVAAFLQGYAHGWKARSNA